MGTWRKEMGGGEIYPRRLMKVLNFPEGIKNVNSEGFLNMKIGDEVFKSHCFNKDNDSNFEK